MVLVLYVLVLMLLLILVVYVVVFVQCDCLFVCWMIVMFILLVLLLDIVIVDLMLLKFVLVVLMLWVVLLQVLLIVSVDDCLVVLLLLVSELVMFLLVLFIVVSGGLFVLGVQLQYCSVLLLVYLIQVICDGQQGMVLLWVWVGIDGCFSEVMIECSSGLCILDSVVCLQVLCYWCFVLVMCDGQVVVVDGLVLVDFLLF